MAKLREKINKLVWSPPKKTYASTSGGTYEDIDREALVNQILNLFKEEVDKLTVIKIEQDMVHGDCRDDAFNAGAQSQLNHTKNEILGVLK